MTPTEIRGAVARLVAAGAKATPGEWRGSMTGHSIKAARDFDEVLFAVPCNGRLTSERWQEWLANVDLAITAANARPALSALAGMCVLPVEVVRVLVRVGAAVSNTNMAEALDMEHARLHAALAAAEAEVARVERGRVEGEVHHA